MTVSVSPLTLTTTGMRVSLRVAVRERGFIRAGGAMPVLIDLLLMVPAVNA